MSSTGHRTLDVLLNVALLSVLMLVLLLPGSIVRRSVESFFQRRAQSRTVEKLWSELTRSSARLDPGDAATVGLVEFGDYECPVCRRNHEDLATFLRDHPDIGVVYRHFPLTATHPRAEAAARAAICAEAQGRFREMHEVLYTTSAWLEDDQWHEVARTAGLPDVAGFEECLQSSATSRRLDEDRSYAARLGLSGTPAFVSRSGVHEGRLTRSELEALLVR